MDIMSFWSCHLVGHTHLLHFSHVWTTSSTSSCVSSSWYSSTTCSYTTRLGMSIWHRLMRFWLSWVSSHYMLRPWSVSLALEIFCTWDMWSMHRGYRFIKRKYRRYLTGQHPRHSLSCADSLGYAPITGALLEFFHSWGHLWQISPRRVHSVG